ncbi:MAG: hypothetical protein SGI89_05595 [bacterium]|nr:hypothetical protein [bacterium]
MKSKFNLKKEFHNVVISITKKFMLERCKLYKVRHRKNEDTLETLCVKYLRKLDKMKPWEIPDDEYGNAGWVNPDRILEDDAIKLTLARLIDHPTQKVLEENVRNRIRGYIKEIEYKELYEKYR